MPDDYNKDIEAQAILVAELERQRDEARAVAYCLSHAWLHDTRPLESWISQAQQWAPKLEHLQINFKVDL